jgi:hypothetical protein
MGGKTGRKKEREKTKKLSLKKNATLVHPRQNQGCRQAPWFWNQGKPKRNLEP